MSTKAPIATLKRLGSGVPGLPRTFTAIQEGLSADGFLVVHGIRVGDVVIAATDLTNGASVLTKFNTPASVADSIEQDDSNSDQSGKMILFVVQRG